MGAPVKMSSVLEAQDVGDLFKERISSNLIEGQ